MCQEPVIRMCVSRQYAVGLRAAEWLSVTFMPPVKPTRPSHTTIFLCVRKSGRRNRSESSFTGLNHAKSTPASRSGVRNAFFSLFEPVQNLSQQYNIVQSAGAALKKIFELLDVEPSLTDAADAVDLPPVRGEIRFEDVSFAYGDGERVKSSW